MILLLPRVRDGLPLLALDDAGEVRGAAISFKTDSAEQAYQTIAEFEPRAHYRWDVVTLVSPADRAANALVGKRPDQGSVQHEAPEWSRADDRC